MNYPEATPEYTIVNTEEQKLRRANHILYSLKTDLYDLNFLDFGCGEGHCVSAAKANLSVGYDIIPLNRPDLFNEWNIIKKVKYDVVLLYDVLDHAEQETPVEILNKIKSVLNKEGKVFVRCHPWSSRHGSHAYKTDNRAFIHLFNKKPIGNKVILPHQTYTNWFNQCGFKIIKQITHRQPIEPFIKNKLHELRQWDNLDITLFNEKKYYSYGEMNNNLANYGNAIGHITPVGQYPCNALGLYDMHGNLWEWCSDWYADYNPEEQINPQGPLHGWDKSLRGGSFVDDAPWLRSAQRGLGHPDVKTFNYGFRCVSSEPYEGFILIKGGQFTMGSQFDEPHRQGLARDETPHEVYLNNFYMSPFMVTQKLFNEVMGYNPSQYKNEDCPVENVSWHESVLFCNKMNCRLPTEAEWEYACRAQNNSLEDILSINFIDYVLST